MRRTRQRRGLALIVGLCVLALVAAACNGDTETATPADPTPDDGATTTPEPVEETEEPTEEPTEDQTEDEDGTETAFGRALECGEMTIGFSQPIPNPAIDLIRDIIETEAGEHGHDLTFAVANLDPNQQISDIDTMLQQGIDVLVAYPVDTQAVQPALNRAQDEGIPVVVVDTTGDGPWEAAVVTGNYEAAKLAGDYLAGEIGEGGTVGVIEGPPFVQTLIDRNTGFADAIEEGGLEQLASGTGNPQSPDDAREIADAWRLQHGEELDGILTFSDLNAIGAASAMTDGYEPMIVSINGEPQAIEAIRAGRIDATADVQPVAVGLAIYHAAEHAFCGEDLPREIHIPPVMVTPDNADSWRPWEEQQGAGFTLELEVSGDRADVVTDGLTFSQ